MLLLSELADELFAHLLESGIIEDASEAMTVSASFIVERFEQGWRFTKFLGPDLDEQERDNSVDSIVAVNSRGGDDELH